LSGSGKSTISTLLLKKCRAIRLRSDIERKRLFGLNESDKTTSTIGDGIYTLNANTQTYQHLLTVGEQLLSAGYSVIIDAAFLKYNERHLFKIMAENIGVPFLIISCKANIATLEDRINSRLSKNNDPSEADINVLAQQRLKQEPLNENELLQTLVVDTEDPTLIEKAISRLQKDFYV